MDGDDTVTDSADSEPPPIHQGTPHVLVVDDDPVFGAMMSRVAEQSMMRVTTCRSEAEALRAPIGAVSAAIIDFELDGTDGLELTKKLEKRGLRGPVILVSGGRAIGTPLSQWPRSVKGFLEKSVGHFAILEAAMSALDAATQAGVEDAVRR